MSWIKETLGTEKPIIAMCHMPAMPGDPYYDRAGGIEKILDSARRDVYALQVDVTYLLEDPAELAKRLQELLKEFQAANNSSL